MNGGQTRPLRRGALSCAKRDLHRLELGDDRFERLIEYQWRQRLKLQQIVHATPYVCELVWVLTMPTISPTSSTNGHRPSGETSEARIAKALAHP
ncbi:hypothetical protein OM076_37725, partial [Solirubrobacter ginsenosidimutans]